MKLTLIENFSILKTLKLLFWSKSGTTFWASDTITVLHIGGLTQQPHDEARPIMQSKLDNEYPFLFQYLIFNIGIRQPLKFLREMRENLCTLYWSTCILNTCFNLYLTNEYIFFLLSSSSWINRPCFADFGSPGQLSVLRMTLGNPGPPTVLQSWMMWMLWGHCRENYF